ncbi:MAG: nucleoside recognition domain-containing protein [Bacteroidales bacterium]
MGALRRIGHSIKLDMPKSLSTALWLIRITVTITLALLFLEYWGVLPFVANLLNPLFALFGLSGKAALAFVTGYFINVYSAVAVISTLNLDIKSLTILGAMILCAHNIITETAVQKKSGSSAVRMVLVRTISAFASAFILFYLLPEGEAVVERVESLVQPTLLQMLQGWFLKTLPLIAIMTTLILSLTILQIVLRELGVIKWMAKGLKPVMSLFGLSPESSFLWIVANVMGLAYGAAIMIGELEGGKISQKESDLLNHHIGISHSNLEDLLLIGSTGAIIGWLLSIRWLLSLVIVWGVRLELRLREKKSIFVG